MAYEVGDIAKELTVALINRVSLPSSADKLYPAKWVGNAYKIIYKAVVKPNEPIEKD